MTSNPYEPFTTQILQDHSVAARLNWHAILIAIAICLGVSLIVGFGFGIVCVILSFTIGLSVTTYLDSQILTFAGFVAGFIPSVVGAFYLGQTIESRWLTHACIYSFANLLITVLFMLIPSESGNSWTEIGYCVLLIPVEIACVLFATRYR